MIHVDEKKLGNIPDGGGWRYVGRQQGERNRSSTPDKPRNKYANPLMGKAYVHTVVDDYSHVAYAEIHDDETALTATAVLARAVDWFGQRGVIVERVLSDNGVPTDHTCGETPVLSAVSRTNAPGLVRRIVVRRPVDLVHTDGLCNGSLQEDPG